MALEALAIVAKLTLDKKGFDDGMDDASGKASGLGSKIKSGLGTAAKVATAAIAAAATATVALVKSSVEGYAEYEQLVGGVKKLYGNMGQSVEEYAAAHGKSVAEVQGEWQQLENAQNLVFQNAQKAFATAGMSTNQYLDTATSFSAALINSLEGDTVAAAELTDVAMMAIADNFNTFGGDINTIQSAFQGFAKQNYTMLDNLKLGYGGTKTEMERLIADANEYAVSIGQSGDLTIESFADIVTAIDLVQQKQGIAGTTAREAQSTIQGSLMMTKAAWQNLVVGFADSEADMSQLISNVVESGRAAFSNLIPVIGQALQGIGQFVQEIAPIISAELPGLVSTVLPMLLDSATQLINGVVAALPSLITVLAEQAPMIIETLINGLVQNIPALVEAAAQLVAGIVTGLINSIPALLQGVVELGRALLNAFLGFFGIHSPSTVMEEAGTNLVQGLINGIANMISDVTTAISNVANAIKETLSNAWNNVKERASEAWQGIKTTVTDKFSSLKTSLTTGVTNLGSVLSTKWNSIKATASTVWGGISSTVSNIWGNLKTNVSNKASEMWNNVTSRFEAIRSGISEKITSAKDTVSNMIDRIKGFFDFSWSLPHLKLPHLSITGSFGITPPSVPHFSIEWYKKAMDNAMILNGATIFGQNGNTLLGGGEAGPEVVVGAGTLMEMIREASGGQNNDITINVYASPNHDEKKIAAEVERVLSASINRRRASALA